MCLPGLLHNTIEFNENLFNKTVYTQQIAYTVIMNQKKGKYNPQVAYIYSKLTGQINLQN